MKQHSPGFLKVAEAARAVVSEVTAAAVRDELASRKAGDRLIVLDVREDHEWSAGHVPGAEHLGRGILERDVEKRIPDATTPIVCYCGGGYRSAMAAETLGRMGYTNVRSMAGGWSGWTSLGFPVEK